MMKRSERGRPHDPPYLSFCEPLPNGRVEARDFS